MKRGAPGQDQDIFRGDVSCQTHFFRGWGGYRTKFGVGPFGGGGGQVCPALHAALS